MTNTATNADGSITVTLPGHLTELGVDPIVFLIWVFAGLLMGIIVWMIVRRKRVKPN
jgi:amino acid transporter